MKIAVLGGDGYCGWATALYLSKQGHEIAIIDNFARRQWDHELGAQTLTPIRPLSDRLRVWNELTGHTIQSFIGDVTDYEFLAWHDSGVRARGGHSFRRAAFGALLDDRPQARGVHAGEQRGRHTEFALCAARAQAGMPPDQAGHDGRIRHSEHRYRRGLHHDRAQRPQGRAAVSRSSRGRSTTSRRCTTATTSCSRARCGDCARRI